MCDARAVEPSLVIAILLAVTTLIATVAFTRRGAAVKFSPDGGEVAIRTANADDQVVTSVQDHGIGIPRAARDRIFERFSKVDRARLRAEAGGATGLGLAISRHVVEQHGGRIWVESQEGSGSTFSFALPAGEDAQASGG